MECVTNGWASSNPGLETFCAMEQENLASQKKKNKKLSLQREGILAKLRREKPWMDLLFGFLDAAIPESILWSVS